MKIFYENSKGHRLELSRWPLMLQEPERLFAHEWSYDTIGNTGTPTGINSFYKGVTEKTAEVSVFAKDEAEFKSAIDGFHRIVDIDPPQKSPGKLYIDEEQYMRCYIFATEMANWDYGFDSVDFSIRLVTDYPYWITEKKVSFYPAASESTDGSRDYPYGYPYGYKPTGVREYLTNTHYSPVPFTMQVFGPCINPRIEINKHVYEVLVTLQKDEYLDICALVGKHTVVKVSKDGTQVSCFNLRNWESSLFKPIPEDTSTVEWNGSFGFDITLYEERSEPRWTL